MFQNLIQWVRSLFGKIVGQRTQQQMMKSDEYKRRYEDTLGINFDAIFGGALANKAVNDCNISITDANDGESARSEFISTVLTPVWDNIKQTTAQALGKGGKFLVPYVTGDSIYVAVIDQTRAAINDIRGDGIITSLSVIAEIKQIKGDYYQRIIDYTVVGDTLSIKTRIINTSGGEVPYDIAPEWASITPEITIGNVDRVPVGFLKCPKDSRREDEWYGVPITYGCGDTIRQLNELIVQIESEYKLKKAFVGADELMFGKDGKLPDNGLFKVFRSGGALKGDGGKSFWEVFDPPIRDTSYYARYNVLCAQLEKEVGTSRGILTEPATYGATATEIKAGNYDTFCLVCDIRKNIQKCFEDLAYAVDIYAEHFGLTPAGASGDYKVTFDWDMSLVESTEETFAQLSELESRGLISGARLNSFVTGQSMEDAQAEIDAAQDQKTKAAAELINPMDFEPENGELNASR